MERQDSIELIYQTVKEKVDLAFQDIEHLETKAGILIGFDGIIISLALKDMYQQAYSPLLVASVFLFFFALILNLWLFLAKKYRRDPNPRKLMEEYWNVPREKIVRQLIANLVQCYEYNEGIISSSAYCINWSICLTALGLGFLIASVFKN